MIAIVTGSIEGRVLAETFSPQLLCELFSPQLLRELNQQPLMVRDRVRRIKMERETQVKRLAPYYESPLVNFNSHVDNFNN